MGRVGLEPTVADVSDQCFIQLSYRPKLLLFIYYTTSLGECKPPKDVFITTSALGIDQTQSLALLVQFQDRNALSMSE